MNPVYVNCVKKQYKTTVSVYVAQTLMCHGKRIRKLASVIMAHLGICMEGLI